MDSFDSIKIISLEKKGLPYVGKVQSYAKVEFYSEDKLIDTRDVKCFDQETIFSLLDKEQELDLSESLVLDFDLDKYRKLRDIPESTPIEIKNVIAQDTIFFSKEEINFRRAYFTGQTANFRDAHFLAEVINFQEANFEKTEENFHSCIFKAQEINFSNSVFGTNMHDFRNSKFDGKKIFENITFHAGEIDFVGVDFGDGDISYTGTHFGDGRVLFRLSVFGKGRKDFSRVNFGQGDVSFEKVEFGDGDVNFRSTIFGNGKKDFRRCSFGAGKINFSNAVFGNGTVEFVNTDFGTGKLSYKLAEFGRGNIDFHYCHFGDGDVQFDKTNFGQGVLDFRAVDFDNCRVIFNRVEIAVGDIIFEASQMQSGFVNFKNSILGRGEFNFSNCVYPESDIIIENVDFGQGAITMKSSKFKDIVLRGSQINNYFDLRVSECQKLDMSEAVIKDVIDIMSYTHNITIHSIDLRGVRLLGLIYVSWTNLNIKELILRQESSWEEKAEQFRMLKENFRNLGMYNEEDLAYVEFKRAEAKALLEKRKKQGPVHAIAGRFSHWLNVLIMDKIGNYATNPLRVLISMVIVYLSFTLAYLALEMWDPSAQIVSSLFPPGDPHVLNSVAKAFYHSAITFLTIGYGDYYPSGISRWLSAIEGFMGLFMMSYFTVAFVRKILR